MPRTTLKRAPLKRVSLKRAALLLVAAAVSVAVLAGCSSGDSLANGINNKDKNYVSGNGLYTEYSVAARKAPVEFSGTSDENKKISSADYAGKVFVVNFWYAGCPPCRKEAPLLERVATKYAGKVDFLGVNTYDQAATSRAFARSLKVSYPSILDADKVTVQAAFAGSVPPNAVPTTLVIDREGRVAARWSGLIEDDSTLSSLIDKVLAEEK